MSISNTNTGITITDKGVTIPDTALIRQERARDFREVWGQDLDIAPYTPQGQIIDSETAIIDDKNAQLQFVLNQIDPEKSEGAWQEGVGKIYFITRDAAQPTIVTVQCVGIVGTVIPTGALVQDDSNRLYELIQGFIINTPSPISAEFRCQDPGPIECPADTIHRIVTQIPGWDTVTNTHAGIVGRNEETRASFEHKRYDTVAKNAHGNLSAVWSALANLDGVISVQMVENVLNVDKTIKGVLVHGHSFFISIVGGSPTDIAWTIYERKDGGCGYDGNTEVTILIPTFNAITTQPKVVRFNRPSQIRGAVRINIATNADTPGNIDDLMRDAIKRNWNGLVDEFPRVQIGDTVTAARFYPTCLEVEAGVYSLIRIRVGRADNAGVVTSWGDAIGFSLNEFPSIQDEDIHVVHGVDLDDSGGDGKFFRYNPDTGKVELLPYVLSPQDIGGNFVLASNGFVQTVRPGE